MMSCEFMKSQNNQGDWVTLYLDSDKALPYLKTLRDLAIAIEHDLITSDDTSAASPHFDFAVRLIDTIHRIESEQKGGAN